MPTEYRTKATRICNKNKFGSLLERVSSNTCKMSYNINRDSRVILSANETDSPAQIHVNEVKELILESSITVEEIRHYACKNWKITWN